MVLEVMVQICKECQAEFPVPNRWNRRRYCSRGCYERAASKRNQERYRSFRMQRSIWKVLPCLKCGLGFESWGPGNRLCERCRLKNAEIHEVAVMLIR